MSELDRVTNAVASALLIPDSIKQLTGGREWERTLEGLIFSFSTKKEVPVTLYVTENENGYNITCWTECGEVVEQVFRTVTKEQATEPILMSLGHTGGQSLMEAATLGKRVFNDGLEKPMDTLSSILFVEGTEQRKTNSTHKGKVLHATSVGQLITDPTVTVLVTLSDKHDTVSLTVMAMNSDKPDFKVNARQWLRQENWIMFAKQALEHLG